MSIYLFTACYPYLKAEGFLEEELLYLSSRFETITIVPLGGHGEPTRDVPANCVVLKPIIKSRSWKFFHGLFCGRSFGPFFKDLFRQRAFMSKTKFREWLASYFNTNCAIKSKQIKDIEANLKDGDICYFYWGKGLNTLSVFLNKKVKYISRFHGEWDLWEESAKNYAPIRKEIVRHLDLAVFISQKGEAYFKRRYPFCKSIVSRLGSRDCGKGKRSTDGVLRVVSCSSVWWLKRVPLIFEALQEMDEKIEWTHIGTGEDFGKLQELVSRNRKTNLKINLLGRLKHDDVLHYYEDNPVDVFINVSTNEGIPVSIMEAISFDIPVVATDVGSNSEVATPFSGILLSPNPSPLEIVSALRRSQTEEFHPRDYWNEVYNAEKNYSAFAEQLKAL